MKAVLVAVAALAFASAALAAPQEASPPAPPTPSPAAPLPSPSPAAPSPSPSPGPPKTSAGADGFAIESADGDFRLRARGYVQFDGRFYPGGDAPDAGTSTFLLRRVRPILQGRLGRYFEFELMPDFGGGSAGIEDAYLDVRMSSSLRIRAGKYKAPVGLERLQSSTNLAFVERALPTGLVPNRDVGAMVHGELGSGVLAYAAGVFNGARDGGSLDGDTNDGKDVAARVFVSPFKRGSTPLRDLGFGIAGTTGTQEGAVPAYRSGGQVAHFSYARDVVADGTRTRVVPQLSYYRGPFGLMAEYVRSRAAMRRSRLEKSVAHLTVEAWQATAAWVLTGEPKSYAAVRPGRPFDPEAGQWGALELVARVNGFMADDLAFKDGFADPDASARKALAWGVGINWYLTRHVKQVASFERTSFTGGAPGGSDRPAENALFIRTQVAF